MRVTIEGRDMLECTTEVIDLEIGRLSCLYVTGRTLKEETRLYRTPSTGTLPEDLGGDFTGGLRCGGFGGIWHPCARHRKRCSGPRWWGLCRRPALNLPGVRVDCLF